MRAISLWKILLPIVNGGPRYTSTYTDPPRHSSLLRPFSAPARPLWMSHSPGIRTSAVFPAHHPRSRKSGFLHLREGLVY
ncbi:hypothetical protein EV421DRAFT_1839972 [Armillaria borealis]|uniref:Uncharacterized protein n=1 Tax=Armillaria borealis TaxID=47425 RepID=A0AA39J514_9AGAR|nr:hypothetical protein EV421DRAFT_1839972 [Armillaria borealis]